jgi:16S rRNA (guanine966-N2)-methyltransferase
MKDRTREALFNLLGGFLDGFLAIDLFAGSGILAFEAISRGATNALAVEWLSAMASGIESNAAKLDIQQLVQVVRQDALAWGGFRSLPTDQPWVVFFCPPYALWNSSGADLAALIDKVVGSMPSRSLIAIEGESTTGLQGLPNSLSWDVRPYPPALLAIAEKREFLE